uniref:Uncharacterized protein n=1 Tax=Aegilops tauschii subsp. strangulata TaxID=200361 RepID=A0A453MV96_AEGTS
MQSIIDGLTQRIWLCSGGSWVSNPAHAAVRIVEKWWRQHAIDSDDGTSQVPGLELRGENLGLTGVGYTWQWRCFCVVILLKTLLGYAQIGSSG